MRERANPAFFTRLSTEAEPGFHIMEHPPTEKEEEQEEEEVAHILSTASFSPTSIPALALAMGGLVVSHSEDAAESSFLLAQQLEASAFLSGLEQEEEEEEGEEAGGPPSSKTYGLAEALPTSTLTYSLRELAAAQSGETAGGDVSFRAAEELDADDFVAERVRRMLAAVVDAVEENAEGESNPTPPSEREGALTNAQSDVGVVRGEEVDGWEESAVSLALLEEVERAARAELATRVERSAPVLLTETVGYSVMPVAEEGGGGGPIFPVTSSSVRRDTHAPQSSRPAGLSSTQLNEESGGKSRPALSPSYATTGGFATGSFLGKEVHQVSPSTGVGGRHRVEAAPHSWLPSADSVALAREAARGGDSAPAGLPSRPPVRASSKGRVPSAVRATLSSQAVPQAGMDRRGGGGGEEAWGAPAPVPRAPRSAVSTSFTGRPAVLRTYVAPPAAPPSRPLTFMHAAGAVEVDPNFAAVRGLGSRSQTSGAPLGGMTASTADAVFTGTLRQSVPTLMPPLRPTAPHRAPCSYEFEGYHAGTLYRQGPSPFTSTAAPPPTTTTTKRTARGGYAAVGGPAGGAATSGATMNVAHMLAASAATRAASDAAATLQAALRPSLQPHPAAQQKPRPSPPTAPWEGGYWFTPAPETDSPAHSRRPPPPSRAADGGASRAPMSPAREGVHGVGGGRRPTHFHDPTSSATSAQASSYPPVPVNLRSVKSRIADAVQSSRAALRRVRSGPHDVPVVIGPGRGIDLATLNDAPPVVQREETVLRAATARLAEGAVPPPAPPSSDESHPSDAQAASAVPTQLDTAVQAVSLPVQDERAEPSFPTSSSSVVGWASAMLFTAQRDAREEEESASPRDPDTATHASFSATGARMDGARHDEVVQPYPTLSTAHSPRRVYTAAGDVLPQEAVLDGSSVTHTAAPVSSAADSTAQMLYGQHLALTSAAVHLQNVAAALGEAYTGASASGAAQESDSEEEQVTMGLAKVIPSPRADATSVHRLFSASGGEVTSTGEADVSVGPALDIIAAMLASAADVLADTSELGGGASTSFTGGDVLPPTPTTSGSREERGSPVEDVPGHVPASMEGAVPEAEAEAPPAADAAVPEAEVEAPPAADAAVPEVEVEAPPAADAAVPEAEVEAVAPSADEAVRDDSNPSASAAASAPSPSAPTPGTGKKSKKKGGRGGR